MSCLAVCSPMAPTFFGSLALSFGCAGGGLGSLPARLSPGRRSGQVDLSLHGSHKPDVRTVASLCKTGARANSSGLKWTTSKTSAKVRGWKFAFHNHTMALEQQFYVRSADLCLVCLPNLGFLQGDFQIFPAGQQHMHHFFCQRLADCGLSGGNFFGGLSPHHPE